MHDSYLEIGSKVNWNGEVWTLRNYHKGNDKAAISKWLTNGTMVTEGVPLSELEKQNLGRS
jgi:hypothetical protein